MESEKEIRSFYENVGRFYDFMIAVVSFVGKTGSNLLADLHISKLCITVPPKLAIVPYGTSTTGGLICPNFPSLKKE